MVVGPRHLVAPAIYHRGILAGAGAQHVGNFDQHLVAEPGYSKFGKIECIGCNDNAVRKMAGRETLTWLTW